MLFWATLGFGLMILLVVFLFPRLAFTLTLLVLLDKSGWLQFMDKRQPDASESLSLILIISFVTVALVGGIILDIYDHINRY